jgi:hypothetical protein
MKIKMNVETQEPSPDKESNSQMLRWNISMEIKLMMMQQVSKTAKLMALQAYYSSRSTVPTTEMAVYKTWIATWIFLHFSQNIA